MNRSQNGYKTSLLISAFCSTGGLSVTGFYATQFIVERARGKYLGFCRLEQFMAHEMGLRLDQQNGIATPAKRDGSKSEPKPLIPNVWALLQRLQIGRKYV